MAGEEGDSGCNAGQQRANPHAAHKDTQSHPRTTRREKTEVRGEPDTLQCRTRTTYLAAVYGSRPGASLDGQGRGQFCSGAAGSPTRVRLQQIPAAQLPWSRHRGAVARREQGQPGDLLGHGAQAGAGFRTGTGRCANEARRAGRGDVAREGRVAAGCRWDRPQNRFSVTWKGGREGVEELDKDRLTRYHEAAPVSVRPYAACVQ